MPSLSWRGRNLEVARDSSLGGQPAPFTLIQLYQFREQKRIAAPMNALTKDFSDDDLRWFSEEIAKLPPPLPPEEGSCPGAAREGTGCGPAPPLRFLSQPRYVWP